MSKRNKDSNKEKITEVKFLMPTRDKALLRGMDELMEIILKYGTENYLLIKKALDIYQNYVSEEDRNSLAKEKIAEQEKIMAELEERKEQINELCLIAEENGQAYDEKVNKILEDIPEEGIPFENGAYTLLKNGYIYSKKKKGNLVMKETNSGPIMYDDIFMYWHDYVVELSINSIRGRVSLKLLSLALIDCYKNHKPIELNLDELKHNDFIINHRYIPGVDN